MQTTTGNFQGPRLALVELRNICGVKMVYTLTFIALLCLKQVQVGALEIAGGGLHGVVVCMGWWFA